MRVLFSNPPWFPDQGQRWGIRAGSRWPFTVPPGSCYYPFPFLLAYATSYLREHGVLAYLVDSVVTRESLASYFQRLDEIGFDWVVLETSTPSIEYDLVLAEEAAKYSKVALAGPHATAFAEELIEKPFVQAVLKGEYERSSLRLSQTGEAGIYDYDPVEDLDELPFPYRDHLLYRYSDRFPNTPPGTQLQMWGSRGCPFGCIFCLWPPVMYQNRYRARKPEFILREIEETVANFPDVTSVYFDDDTFNLGHQRVQEICRGMKELGLPWAAMCRADTSSPETFELMAASGCYAVKFGVESGCQELVDACRKKLDLERVKESVKLLRDRGVWVHCTFTWGLPGETEETIRRTRKFYRELQPSSAQESLCTPFPGTPFYEVMQRTEKLRLTDWRMFDGALTSVVHPDPSTGSEWLRQARLRPRLFVVGPMHPQYMGPWFVRAAPELGYEPVPIDLWRDPSEVTQLLTSEPDDILLADKGAELPPPVLEHVAARKILYYPDILPMNGTAQGTEPTTDPSLSHSPTLPHSHTPTPCSDGHAAQRYREFSLIASLFDAVILHDYHALDYLRDRGHRNIVGYVILPYEPTLHRKLDRPKTEDLVFIGSRSRYRMEILQHLSRRRPIQWPEVWGEAMVEVLNQARIVLNVHFTPQPNTEHRIIEALACGSFVLSQPLSGPTPFEDGQHLVYFDLDTVHDQIDYYLAHEDEREAIARQGHAYVTARYSARQQLAEILSLAGEN